jgi:cyclic pyranopterin phosphate synthase
MAAKRTPDLIPMCHPLNISSVTLDFSLDEERSRVEIRTTVRMSGQTGVEMEALVATSVAALTIYDMCKAVDKEMVISEIMLREKKGGKSGEFRRSTE